MTPSTRSTPQGPYEDARWGSREFKRDPFPYFARLRRERPVARIRRRGEDAWMVCRYDDARALFTDRRLVKDRRNVAVEAAEPWVPPLLRPLQKNMNDLDPPAHERLRRLVHQAFTPRVVSDLAGRIEELAHECIDRILTRGSTELVEDYAAPIPTTIIAELLGISVADRRRFRRWSSTIVGADRSRFGEILALPAIVAFLRYLRRLVDERRRTPGDDLVSRLVAAEDEGTRLSADELLAMIFLLIVAGHETTTNLIANGTLALIEHPGELARLASEPDLAESAVEELLRFAGPLVTATERYAREEMEIAGVRIPPGGLVLAVVASANRDERRFPEPDRLDLSRDPNRHLAFGYGIHYCMGAPLAHLEARIAFRALAERLPGLRLAVPSEALRWRPGVVVRGLEALPLTFTRPRNRSFKNVGDTEP